MNSMHCYLLWHSLLELVVLVMRLSWVFPSENLVVSCTERLFSNDFEKSHLCKFS